MNTEIWLCEITGQPIPLHDCLECAEHRQVPACPFPPTVLKALANSMRGDDGLLEAQALALRAGVALLRVPSLLGCTRQAWYGLHGRPPLEKPSEHWSRLRGTIFHAALESLAGENAVAETRLIASLEELGAQAWIAGKIDHYDPALRLATDYKTINTFGRKMSALELPKQHHVAQLWIYGWLLGKSGIPTRWPAESSTWTWAPSAPWTSPCPMPSCRPRLRRGWSRRPASSPRPTMPARRVIRRSRGSAITALAPRNASTGSRNTPQELLPTASRRRP